MALTPQNNEAFFREVDDEVRRDQVQRLARSYGAIAIVVIVLGLIGLGGFLFWRNHIETVAGEHGEELTAAMTSLSAGNSAQASKQIDALIKADAKGYTPLAKLLQADMLAQQGKTSAAATAFGGIAADTTAPQPIRDLALVRSIGLSFDTLPAQQVIDRLAPLAIVGNPWFGTAGEMTGIAYLKLKQPQKAGPLFAAIAKDPTVPQTIRSRVSQLAGDLGQETPVQPADMPQP